MWETSPGDNSHCAIVMRKSFLSFLWHFSLKEDISEFVYISSLTLSPILGLEPVDLNLNVKVILMHTLRILNYLYLLLKYCEISIHYKNKNEYINALLGYAKVKCHLLDSYKNLVKYMNKIE